MLLGILDSTGDSCCAIIQTSRIRWRSMDFRVPVLVGALVLLAISKRTEVGQEAWVGLAFVTQALSGCLKGLIFLLSFWIG